MSHLAQLQSDFQAYLLDSNKGAAFAKQIINDNKVGAKKRLSIYADAYRLRIIEALETAYPKLGVLLGDDLFDSTARSYINAHPSFYRNMRWVGDKMDAHLRHTLPKHPIAAEMAAFEWALGLAFDAEDAPQLTIQDLAQIPPENWGDLHFSFHPSMQLLRFDWNAIAVWQALEVAKKPPVALKQKTPCVLWRRDFTSHFRTVEAAEFQAIKQIKAGASFGELCESLMEVSGDNASMQAAQFLAGWLEAGLISTLN